MIARFPHFVDMLGGVFEPAAGLNHPQGRTRYQVIALEDPIHARFGDRAFRRVDNVMGQLTG